MATQCCGQQTYGSSERPKQDKRMQLIDDIKHLIEDIDYEESGWSKAPGGRAASAAAGGGASGSSRGRDRELERVCREYRKRRECSPPVITSIAIHEFRPTSDFTNKQHENSSQVTYVDATRDTSAAAQLDPMPPAPWELPRTPSQELRAGTLYPTCECRRRNGLQHDCPRWGCGGRPECVAVNPGPCCPTSKARKPVRGDRRDNAPKTRQGAEVTAQSHGGLHERGTGSPSQPGLVMPAFVHVGGQAHQQGGPKAGQMTIKGPGVPQLGSMTIKMPGMTCECVPEGVPTSAMSGQSPVRTHMFDPQGGQRFNPGAEKIPKMPGPHDKHQGERVDQQNQTGAYLDQQQAHSANQGAEKITQTPGPFGWTTVGPRSPQNVPQDYAVGVEYSFHGQGGQRHDQREVPRGGPAVLVGPGAACLNQPIGSQQHLQNTQPHFGAPPRAQGPITLQGPGMTCLCRPAGPPSPSLAQHQHQSQGRGEGCVDLYELVMVRERNPGQ